MTTSKLKSIATAAATAAVLAYGSAAQAIPNNTAVADALLTISDFTLFVGDGAAGKSFSPIPTSLIGLPNLVNITGVNNTGDTSATFNGTNNGQAFSGPLIAPMFSLTDSSGPDAGNFTPGTTLPFGTVNGNYAGSHSSTIGNALVPLPAAPNPCGAAVGDCVITHNQISVDGAGVGSATSNNGVTSNFELSVLAPTTLEISFDAELFLRVALGQDQVESSVNSNWSLTIGGGGFGDWVNWLPGTSLSGGCVGAGLCTEFAAAFALNNQGSTTTTNDFDLALSSLGGGGATFELEVDLMPGIVYQFGIRHQTIADAEVLPEPTTLGLMGLGLIGAASAARRKKK